MKIRIVGGSGTGKTTLAKELSVKYGIANYDLDDIFWDNNSQTYGTKRDIKSRDALLNKIVEEDDWIIEGVYFSWCKQTFEKADQIYLLDVPRKVYRRRIIRRFVRRKLGIEKGKKENLKSLQALLKWTDNYSQTTVPEIKEYLERLSDKDIKY